MLKLSRPNISEAAIDSVAKVIRSGQLVHGQECEIFERELTSYLGCTDVVLVSSGTAALHIALLALDIGPGDAVIVPDFTFPATANVIAILGARVVIVDVLPNTYTMDAVQLERVIKDWEGPEHLRAILPVHEFGCVADIEEINRIAQRHGLAVVEDAACALGAQLGQCKVGARGKATCFSFHPRKTLTTGEGGAIATDNVEFATRMRRLRNHGMERSAEGMRFFEPATNYRLTNFQAALGRHQLPMLDEWISARRLLVKEYLIAMQPLVEQGFLQCPEWREGHSWQTYMVVLDANFDRKEIISKLREQGVESNLGAQSLVSIGIYGEQQIKPVIGPVLYEQGLALPLFELMNKTDVHRVCHVITQILLDSK